MIPKYLPYHVVLILLAGVVPVGAMAQAQPKYPAVAPPKDKAAMGVGIQRTMTLLATSTPQHRNKVKILVYGQSISKQD
jgi:hypothetical protein